MDALRDGEIDTSDIPEVGPERFARAIVRQGLRPVVRKEQITLRIDAEVLQWFRAQGAGYQSRMNAVLRAYRELVEDEGRKASAAPVRRGTPGQRRPRAGQGVERPGGKRGGAAARPK